MTKVLKVGVGVRVTDDDGFIVTDTTGADQDRVLRAEEE
jgi:hypothetical protein